MLMYERLLVAVDHSEVSPRVIAAAGDLASLSQGKVWVLHVREREFGRLGLTPSEPDEGAHEAVRDGVEALNQAGVAAQGEERGRDYGLAPCGNYKDALETQAGTLSLGSSD